MSSFASVKGPSTTVRFAPAYFTRHPFELACRPEASSNTPAFCSSSWYFAISVRIFRCGMTPSSESWVAFTMIMNRIVLPPLLALRGCLRPRPTSRREERDGANLALAFPRRPMLGVQAHESDRRFDRFLSRLKFEYGVAAHDFLGLGERPVDHRQVPSDAAHPYAGGAGAEAAGLDQRAVLEGVCEALAHGVLRPPGARPLGSRPTSRSKGSAWLPPRRFPDVSREVIDLLHLAHLDDVAVLHGRALRPLDGLLL